MICEYFMYILQVINGVCCGNAYFTGLASVSGRFYLFKKSLFIKEMKNDSVLTAKRSTASKMPEHDRGRGLGAGANTPYSPPQLFKKTKKAFAGKVTV